MGPKKKGGKKGGKKGKKEEAPPPEEPSEYDSMDAAMLREVVQMLRQQLDKAQVDRNYVQHERDMIESFYDVTKQELREHEQLLLAKDREMEVMEDAHRVEVRVYVQKVKHLEYEHSANAKRAKAEGLGHRDEEQDLHVLREAALRSTKQSLRLELKERDLSNEDEIAQMKQAHDKNLLKLREQFEKSNAALATRCQARLQELAEALELRRKVDLHEIEERKNLHINDLMRNHDKAFAQIKNYYNDITRDNLRLIDSLKSEIAAMKAKAAANTKLMHDVSQENKRLSEPLAAALHEVEHLRYELKDEHKDKLSLRHAQARLAFLTRQTLELRASQAELKMRYRSLEQERNALYDSFEQAVQTIHKKGECKNLVLEQRLAAMDDQHARKAAQLHELLLAADLDPAQARRVTETLDGLLDARNAAIQELQYRVAKESKAFNDALRTFTDKLERFGVPEDELRAMGFKPLAGNVNASPAGLVAVE